MARACRSKSTRCWPEHGASTVTRLGGTGPIHWPPPNGGAPGGTALDCVVGGAETAEFIRQSRAMADLWAAKGVTTRFDPLEGLNHFTVLDPLADAKSGLVRRVVERIKT